MPPQGGEEAMNHRAIQALETLCQRFRLTRAKLLSDFNNTSSQAVWGQINYWTRERQILNYDEAKRLLYLGHAQNPSRGQPRVPSDPNRWIPTDIEEADDIFCREVFKREGIMPRTLPGLGRVRNARNRLKSRSKSPVIPVFRPTQAQEHGQQTHHMQLQQLQVIQQEGPQQGPQRNRQQDQRQDEQQDEQQDQHQEQGDTIVAASSPHPSPNIDPSLQHATATFQPTLNMDNATPIAPSRRSTRTSTRKRRHYDSPTPTAPSSLPTANSADVSPSNHDTHAVIGQINTPAPSAVGEEADGSKLVPAAFTDMSAAHQLLAFQNGTDDSGTAVGSDDDQSTSRKRRRIDQDDEPTASDDACQPTATTETRLIPTSVPIAYKEDKAVSSLVESAKQPFVQKLHQFQDMIVTMAGHHQRLADIDQALGKVTHQLEDATRFLAERREMLANIESKKQMTQAGLEAAEFKVWQENHPALAAQVMGPMKSTLMQLAEDKKEVEYQIKDKTMEMEPLLEEKEEAELQRKTVLSEAGFVVDYKDGDIEQSLGWLEKKIEDLKGYLYILALGPSRVGQLIRDHGGVAVDTSVCL
ncbi:hypothetical protein QBC40DRAFT_283333 [Triangularia verruculosa]|uniref:Uncharacterized protein n=1 Tax=Triangularia verruculosa TaxID=2587418 RepID=A0AAN6XFL5_9PEZI|nr:hypothetical protein QBC40DRAFT_283333 [Triangularia verruculosa]